ncbi:hypothetical protein LIER_10379 [Lithospermum erythrorhizon]|uniref:Pectinesterase inhibitor domain-containing protein n=1 Tax=Lithospermum erythrorhizon TaxID=34254 RepID=A0AAV3PJ50_LITER
MASYATKLLLASLGIACISCSYADLVSDVCARSRVASSCNKVLRTNPSSIRARDLSSLGSAAIDSAHGFTKSAQSMASSLSKTSNDPGLKSCIDNFREAIANLNECRSSLTKKDKSSLNIKASAAYTNVDTCKEEYNAPANLKNEIQNVIDTCSAILALSNML